MKCLCSDIGALSLVLLAHSYNMKFNAVTCASQMIAKLGDLFHLDSSEHQTS